jgi:GH15 family glucan-1,4-alpha-glucosidase
VADSLLLSNGELAVKLTDGELADLYFPYVGLENQIQHVPSAKTGVFLNGAMHWLNDGAWQIQQSYYPGRNVAKISAVNDWLGLRIDSQVFVDSDTNVFARTFHLINLKPQPRDAKLYLCQAWNLCDNRGDDTAQWMPAGTHGADFAALNIYQGKRQIMWSGQQIMPGGARRDFDAFTVGNYGGAAGLLGSYMDAQDGVLSGNRAARGSTDTLMQFDVKLMPLGDARVETYLSAAKTVQNARKILVDFTSSGLTRRLNQTAEKSATDLASAHVLSEVKIAPEYRGGFMIALQLLQNLQDRRGAVLTELNLSGRFARPHVMAAVALAYYRTGLTERAERALQFLADVIGAGGYFTGQYQPDAAFGPNGRGWIAENDQITPPISAADTASVGLAAAEVIKHQLRHHTEIKRSLYDDLIVKSADWLNEFIDPVTHLPRASYDLAGSAVETTTLSVGLTVAALSAAADAAELLKDTPHAIGWRATAHELRERAAQLHDQSWLYGLHARDGRLDQDRRVGIAPLFGAWLGNFATLDELRDDLSDLIEKMAWSSDQPRTRWLVESGGDSFVASAWLARMLLATRDSRQANRLDLVKAVLDEANRQLIEQHTLTEQTDDANAWALAEFIELALAYGNPSNDPFAAKSVKLESDHV